MNQPEDVSHLEKRENKIIKVEDKAMRQTIVKWTTDLLLTTAWLSVLFCGESWWRVWFG
jgi:hypothetical protein